MKQLIKKIIILIILLFLIQENIFCQKEFEEKNILTIIQKVNAHQLAYPNTSQDDYNWVRGTYYTGVMSCFQATNDNIFLKQCMKWGENHNWKVAPRLGKAEGKREGGGEGGCNPLTCTQVWLECYKIKPKKKMIIDIISVIADTIRPKTPASNPEKWFYEGNQMYADALYVGAPVFAMLYNITGDKKYLDILDDFYWKVVDKLYDKESHLFYRDATFIPYPNHNLIKYDLCTLAGAREGKVLNRQISAFDKKIFWSRGNGWVMGSLVRVIKYLPENTPSREKYIKLYKEFSEAVKNCQGEDGYWRANLDDAQEFPNPETSGTGFFVYGLAWGINNGFLDTEKYTESVRKGWKALVKAVDREGVVQWGQRVGHAPAYVVKEDTQEYVTGAFLLAASEVYKSKLSK